MRKDLLATFHRMFDHEAFAQLDWIVIETTGMADPAPLIQSLYMDPECQSRIRLDSVLTVVDCKHLPVHLAHPTRRSTPTSQEVSAEPPTGLRALFNIKSVSDADGDPNKNVSEAILQITFADRILMNKIDLVSEEELSKLFTAVQKINPNAQLIACQNSIVPMEDLLNIRAFDPLQNKALLEMSTSDQANNDEGSGCAAPLLIQVDADGKILRKVVKLGAQSAKSKKPKLSTAAQKILSKHAVGTVSLLCDQAMNLDVFNTWISKLLTEHGADIYRIKGILWMHGYEEQFVVHGVHMIFDGQRGVKWDSTSEEEEETAAAASTAKSSSFGTGSSSGAPAKVSSKVMKRRRYSRLVFIGIGLKKDELENGFMGCVFK